MNLIVVSFHTGTEPYVTKARRLAESCDKLGVPCWICELPDRDTWVENVSMKAQFMLNTMYRLRRPLLWIDADGYLERRPDLLVDCKEDFGIYAKDRNRREWKPIGRTPQRLPEAWPDTRWFLTGTMFFNDTALSLLLLSRWAAAAAVRRRDYQQLLLQEILSDMDPRPSICWLPETYCSIKGRARPTVVFHDLASCEIRNVVRA